MSLDNPWTAKHFVEQGVTVCNFFVYTAGLLADYRNGWTQNREQMRDWYDSPANGLLFKGDEIPWFKMQEGDVLHVGNYRPGSNKVDSYNGHVMIIASSLVKNQEGDVGYMVLHASPRGSGLSREEFMSVSTLFDMQSHYDETDTWLGRSSIIIDSPVPQMDPAPGMPVEDNFG